jgi:tetratricopeptide (TPR) repeat protein
MGEFDAAFPRLEEAVALGQQGGHITELGSALNSYGFVYYMAGDHLRALDYLEQSLAVRPSSGHYRAVTLDNLGYVKAALGRTTEAQGHFIEAMRIAHELHSLGIVFDILVGLAMTLPLPEEGSRAVELLAFVLYSPRSWRESKDRAEPWLRQRAAQLPPEVAAAAEARGRALVFEEVVGELLGMPVERPASETLVEW